MTEKKMNEEKGTCNGELFYTIIVLCIVCVFSS